MRGRRKSMAHDIERMAYAAAEGAPWHINTTKDRSIPVGDNMTPAEIQIAAGLDWTVEKHPVIQLWNGAYREVPDRFEVVRMSDGRVFDICSPIYTPVQPTEALSFSTDFVRAGDMKMDIAGSLAEGARIWALAKLGAGFTLAGGDEVNGYLLLSCPYKVGQAFVIKLTKIRVVCANTHASALSQKAIGNGETFRMAHSKEFDEAMKKEAEKTLGLANRRFTEFREQAEYLSTSGIQSQQALINYVALVSGSSVLEAAAAEADAGAGNVLETMLVADELAAAAAEARRD